MLQQTDQNEDVILSKSEFSLRIEQHSIDNGMELLETIMYFCGEYDIDFTEIPKMITPDLKEKIALSSNVHSTIYGKQNQLPI